MAKNLRQIMIMKNSTAQLHEQVKAFIFHTQITYQEDCLSKEPKIKASRRTWKRQVQVRPLYNYGID